jgi:hypothetical protein
VVDSGPLLELTWTSEPSRFYRIRRTNNIVASPPWTEIGLGLIAPNSAAETTSRTFADDPANLRFFQVEAVKPLSP